MDESSIKRNPKGAGRKLGSCPYGEPTKPIRVPLGIVALVEDMLLERKNLLMRNKGQLHNDIKVLDDAYMIEYVAKLTRYSDVGVFKAMPYNKGEKDE